jgi:hypothetical protein
LDEKQDLIPVEQQTLTFYGKPIVVVRLCHFTHGLADSQDHGFAAD